MLENKPEFIQELLELNKVIVILLFIIVLIQSYFFLETRKNIKKLKNFLSEYKTPNELEIDLNYIEKTMENRINLLENNVQIYINIPLYLGLLGTIVGIVFGVFNIDISNLESGINSLVKEISCAMVTSGLGIFFTILNSRSFVRTFEVVETEKENYLKTLHLKQKENKIYNENKTFQESINELTVNLNKFNRDFETNNKNFREFINKFLDMEFNNIISESQKAIIAIANVQMSVTTQLRDSAEQMSLSVEKIKELNLQGHGIVDKLLETTKNSVEAANSVIKLQCSDLQKSVVESEKNLQETWENTKVHLLSSNEAFTENVQESLANIEKKISKDNEELRIDLQNIANINIEIVNKMQDSLANIENNFSKENETLRIELQNIAKTNRTQAEEVLTNIENNFSKKNEDLRIELQNIAKTNKEKAEEVLTNIENNFSKENETLRIELQNIAKINREKTEEFLKNINATYNTEDLKGVIEVGKNIRELGESSKSLENKIENKINKVETTIETMNADVEEIKTTINETNTGVQELINANKLGFFKRLFRK